jgi:hypothetical protein
MAEEKLVINCRVWPRGNSKYVTCELSMKGLTRNIIVIDMTKEAGRVYKTT